jgi:hypothetical protein
VKDKIVIVQIDNLLFAKIIFSVAFFCFADTQRTNSFFAATNVTLRNCFQKNIRTLVAFFADEY